VHAARWTPSTHPPPPPPQKQTDSEVLRGVSRLDNWVYHVPDSNMDGLKVRGDEGEGVEGESWLRMAWRG